MQVIQVVGTMVSTSNTIRGLSISALPQARSSVPGATTATFLASALNVSAALQSTGRYPATSAALRQYDASVNGLITGINSISSGSATQMVLPLLGGGTVAITANTLRLADQMVEATLQTLMSSGQLSGDKITGKCEFDVNGQTRALEWEAKRDTAKAAAASGNWNTALILGDGNRIEGTLKLKQDGDKLTGATVRNENETQIQDGHIAGDEISFKVIRDRDGRKVTAKYKGKITGDTVKGKVESDWSGDWQTLDWEGTRGK